jgi:DNA-binding CsgD family transcriptional regulator
VFLGSRTVRTYIIVMEAAATLLLIGLVGRLTVTAWHGPRGAFRVASAAASAVCALLGATSLQHLLHVTTRDELVSLGWWDTLLGPLAALRATIVVVTALTVMLGLRYWTILGRAQSMVDALTDRLPSQVSGWEAALSARELEVLDVIRKGVLSDHDISETLHISRATAATHVQNILRKTDLHNRRDLMLLSLERSLARTGGVWSKRLLRLGHEQVCGEKDPGLGSSRQ